MCTRCHGYMIRDYGLEYMTGSQCSLRCVNCGNYIDEVILRNRRLSLAERESHAERVKRACRSHLGDDAYSVFGLGALLLGSDSILGTV